LKDKEEKIKQFEIEIIDKNNQLNENKINLRNQESKKNENI